MTKREHYQSHIDGIRAIAVLVVIVNHLNPAWMPAGYLGVDMFFVISGYVISLSLWERSDWSLKKFILDFYQRRVKRLVPALAFAISFAGVMVCLVVPDPADNLRTGVAALFGVSNFVLYASASDYFATSIKSNIFAHTWSLGVEEQFYLIFPLIFWFATRAEDKRRAVLWVISGVSFLSFAAFVWLYPSDPGEMYFLSPIRFWEMGAGALAFVLEKYLRVENNRKFIYFSALLAIGVLVLLLAAPSRSSACLIVSVVPLTAWIIVAAKYNPALVRVMNVNVVQHIGLTSYSLYLWHWIFIVLARWTFGVKDSTFFWILLATFIFAEISYRCVERPIRMGRFKNPIKIGVALNVLIALIFIYIAPQFKNNFLALEGKLLQSPNAFVDMNGLSFARTCVVDDKTRPIKEDTFRNCTLEPKSLDLPTVWGMGDSHAGHLQAMLVSLHEQTGVGVHLIETPGNHFPPAGRKSIPRETILKEVESRMRPGDIFLLSRLYLDRDGEGVVEDLNLWVKEAQAVAKKLEEKGVSVVVVGPPPMFDFVYKSTCAGFFFSDDKCSIPRERVKRRIEPVEKSLASAAEEQKNLYSFSSFGVICPATQVRCSPIEDDTFMYRDRDHLNLYGASRLTPAFQRFLGDHGLLH